ncbi:MAG: ribonuclease P protein component 4 [Candidatus Bathyarchaeota archaeon]|nr:ribonuclease P protein component 4 [Candidatus Bathyarchaeota archaeon]
MNFTAKQVARRRVHILFEQATCTYEANPELAQSYLLTAKKIAMAARIRMPPAYRRRICRQCNTLLVPGQSSRVRIKPRREPHVVVTCLRCGSQTRIPLKPKNKEKPQIEQNNFKDETSR